MKKIIVIGAGPAGITAAFELLKGSKEFSVKILEESQAIGGISRTVYYKGNRMDIGGHRFFSKDHEVTNWWENLMPIQGSLAYDDLKLGRTVPTKRGGPDPEKEDRVMLMRNRVSRIYYKHRFFDYPVKMNINTIKNMGFLTTMESGFSYMRAVLHKLPENNLENFYINRFGRKLYSMFFEGYTEKLWGRHPKDISADWGAQRVKGLSVIAILLDIFKKIIPAGKNRKNIETSLIEEFSYPKYGPGQLWEIAADEVEKMGGIICKGCKVTNLIKTDGKIQYIEYVKDGKTIKEEADFFISSMPLKDLICGLNDVPKSIYEVANGLPYRDFVTVGLLINKLNLKNQTKLRTLNHLVPDCWIYVQDQGVKLGRIQIFNNWSPYMVKEPDSKVWIGLEYFCNEGDKYWNMSENEWTKFGTKELVKMGVLRNENEVLDSHSECVKKAYPAYFDTYGRIHEVIDYLNDIDNLYCIGRNGQHRYNNMDHSMATAFETVHNIISGKKDKANIWNVNTEKEYHEEK